MRSLSREVLIHVDRAVTAKRHGAVARTVEELEHVSVYLLYQKLLVRIGKLSVPLQYAVFQCSRGGHINAHVAMGIIEGINAFVGHYGHNHPVLSLRLQVDSCS